MRNWIRIFLICFVLLGGTAFFGYWSLSRFNTSLNALRDTCYAVANRPLVLACDNTTVEQIAAVAPEEQIEEVVPEVIPASATTSADLNLSFVFPDKSSEVYIGCAYQISFQSSAPIGSLETTLVDSGAREPIEPGKSGLASENKFEPTSQSLDWTVGNVWPGRYYIKVTDIFGGDLRSDVFKVRGVPSDISADEREKICLGGQSL